MTLNEFRVWLQGYQDSRKAMTVMDYRRVLDKLKQVDGKPAVIDDASKKPTFDPGWDGKR